MTPLNTMRPGSAGYRAFEQLQAHGPCSTARLADALDLPDDELASILAFPVRQGLLRCEDGTWSIGDGRPVGGPPPAPKPAPVTVATSKVPPAVRDLPAAAPPPSKKAPAPRPEGSGLRVSSAPPPPPPPPEPSPPPAEAPPKVVQTLVVPPDVLPKTLDEACIITVAPAPAAPSQPLLCTLPESLRTEVLMKAADAPKWIGVDHGVDAARYAAAAKGWDATAAALEAQPDAPMVAAWCSDGTYVIEKGTARVELNAEDVAQLAAHLEQVWHGLLVESVR